MFTGLLAYDWLRILIWFDHMGLRVATLVNLSFLGGDRADEAAARFVGHHGRTRAIPDGIRRFGTWAPLLIPFYIPRGPSGTRPGPGRRRSRAAARPCRTRSGRWPSPMPPQASRSPQPLSRPFSRSAPRLGQRGRGSMARRLNLRDGRNAMRFNNGAVGLEIQRDGRGAAFVMGAERGGFAIDLFRRPLDPLTGARPFLLCERGGRGALVDRL